MSTIHNHKFKSLISSLHENDVFSFKNRNTFHLMLNNDQSKNKDEEKKEFKNEKDKE